MKKLFPSVLILTLTVCSCKKHIDQETVNKITDDMCTAMQIYNVEDPRSILEVKKVLAEIAKNSDSYKNVSEKRFEETMKLNCPKGYKKYKTLMAAE